MKKLLIAGVMAAAVAALGGVGTSVSAQERLWSVAVHLAYMDGSSYDIVLGRGLTTADMTSMLQDCGRSHRTGSVVRYHCYPIPE